jgi:hypothetical protein
MGDTDQRVREVAYFLWREEGCPDGEADRHWRRAETMVEAEDAERKKIEAEPPGDAPSEILTPLSTLKRSSPARSR